MLSVSDRRDSYCWGAGGQEIFKTSMDLGLVWYAGMASSPFQRLVGVFMRWNGKEDREIPCLKESFGTL